MRSGNSGFRKLVQLCHLRGFRHGLKTAASKIVRRYLRPPFQVPAYLEIVLREEHPASLKPSIAGPLRINWILPDISAGRGGLINVFRAIQQLEEWGHENRVYVLSALPGNAAFVNEHIRKNYFSIRAQVEAFSGKVKDSDALIATSWPTAYAARSIGNTAGKFYFVQDLEHEFYAPGSLYELARQTYRFGFRGVTAGTWIAEVLRREFNMECSSFGFSYDRNLYVSTGPRLLPPGKKRLLFYARPETERRGFELGALALSLIARKMAEIEFVLVGCPPRALKLPFPATYPGILPLAQLGALYRSCDLALVLSHTNLSLLPLELMACGCPVVSNTGPNVEWLLSRETAQLAKADPKSLAAAITALLTSEESRQRKINAGLAFANSTSWTKEVRAIEFALLAVRERTLQLTSNA